MIWDVIGVTGWALPMIVELTFPQLTFVTEGRGRILYPRLEPVISANLANLSAEPNRDGTPTEVDKIIQRWQQAKAGIIVPPTAKEKKLGYARRILLASYLGDPDAVEEPQQQTQQSKPFPGMGRDEAQAWVQFVKSGACPDFVWLEICDVYQNIFAAAQAGQN